MDDPLGRRDVLKAVGAAGFAGIVGFVGMERATDPEVVDIDAPSRLVGDVLLLIEVENGGGPGGVEVTVRLKRAGTVLREASEVVTMSGGERRKVRVEADAPRGTDGLSATARATEFPDRYLAGV